MTNLDLLSRSFFFLRRHAMVIMSLGLIAAFGRVAQLGGFGEIPGWGNVVLEFLVEGSRVAIFLIVLGIERIRTIGKVFHSRSDLIDLWRRSISTIKRDWVKILISAMGFLIIVGLLNFLIDQLAYETCLFLSLKQDGILVPTSSEWTVLLFFKNILVVPFTIVFETVVLLWLMRQRSVA